MRVARFSLPAVCLTLALAACSDHINPRDGRVEEPIPVGVSVAPQRSAPQTGGLNLAAQDSVVPTAGMPGIMDTARAGAPAAQPPAAGAVPTAGNAPAPTPGTDTIAAPRPR
jgi:hypothetical protein